MSIQIYSTYLVNLEKAPPIGKIMPYDWYEFPSSVGFEWMPYSWMLDEFARELANIINAFTNNVHQLASWDLTLAELDDNGKFQTVIDFIDPLATNALLLPYVIKSRFAFAAAHLSHQANKKIKDDWKDDLPLENAIYLNVTDQYGKNWSSYVKFKRAIEAISDATFKIASLDFRNAYNHRFSPRFVIGHTSYVVRKKNGTSGISYNFGENKPLQLENVVDFLTRELGFCYEAFAKFQALVNEQLAVVTNYTGPAND